MRMFSLQTSGILLLCMTLMKILISWASTQLTICLSASVGILSGSQVVVVFSILSCLSVSPFVTSYSGSWVGGCLCGWYVVLTRLVGLWKTLPIAWYILWCQKYGTVLCFDEVLWWLSLVNWSLDLANLWLSGLRSLILVSHFPLLLRSLLLSSPFHTQHDLLAFPFVVTYECPLSHCCGFLFWIPPSGWQFLRRLAATGYHRVTAALSYIVLSRSWIFN